MNRILNAETSKVASRPTIRQLRDEAKQAIHNGDGLSNPQRVVADALNRVTIALTYLAERPSK